MCVHWLRCDRSVSTGLGVIGVIGVIGLCALA